MLLERDDLLTRLRGLLDRAAVAQGHLVFVAGEAGVGKTSLLTTLTAEVQQLRPEITVRRGACDELLTPAPLGPVLEAFPELADQLEERGGRTS